MREIDGHSGKLTRKAGLEIGEIVTGQFSPEREKNVCPITGTPLSPLVCRAGLLKFVNPSATLVRLNIFMTS